ncbi:hypothetical protein EON66_06070, partial [archaeon]
MAVSVAADSASLYCCDAMDGKLAPATRVSSAHTPSTAARNNRTSGDTSSGSRHASVSASGGVRDADTPGANEPPANALRASPLDERLLL